MVGERTSELAADVSEAHRQVPIDPGDLALAWGQNTFRRRHVREYFRSLWVASASYCPSGVAAAGERISQYLAGSTAAVWRLLVADGFHLEAGGPSYREALMAYFILRYSWSTTFVEQDNGRRRRLLGRVRAAAQKTPSSNHAETCRIPESSTVNFSGSEEVLGRVMFVAGVVEHESPFLGPPYRFLSIHPRRSELSLPSRRYSLRSSPNRWHCVIVPDHFRRRAKGLLSVRRTSKREHGWDRWLVARTPRRRTAQFLGVGVVSSRGEEVRVAMGLRGGKLAIAYNLHIGSAGRRDRSLSVLWNAPEEEKTQITLMPTWTNDQANGALNKLMTTQYQASAVNVELSCCLKRLAIEAVVERSPRAINKGACSLANCDTTRFDLARRRHVRTNAIQWEMLPDALKMGQGAEDEARMSKEKIE